MFVYYSWTIHRLWQDHESLFLFVKNGTGSYLFHPTTTRLTIHGRHSKRSTQLPDNTLKKFSFPKLFLLDCDKFLSIRWDLEVKYNFKIPGFSLWFRGLHHTSTTVPVLIVWCKIRGSLPKREREGVTKNREEGGVGWTVWSDHPRVSIPYFSNLRFRVYLVNVKGPWVKRT